MDLNSITSPADIKSFGIGQLEQLCSEMRAALLQRLSACGGHVGPNLGVVEATVALHYVFDAPSDKIVFDVSHQSYAHKMLTGRMQAYTDPDHYRDVTGFTCPGESEYDLFEIGHTSTSISLATGLAKARDLAGGKENIIAFIGDASLGGGMALEALNYAPELRSNIIIILNDNQMSIGENHGALYSHLSLLRSTNGTSPDNIFKALGYEYIYVAEGNNIRSLVKTFKEVKDAPRAVIVHINTMKGMGLPCAESNKEQYHFSAPFDLRTGSPINASSGKSYTDIFAEYMLRRMQADRRIVTLNAGTPGAIGFTPSRRKAAGEQYVDVGIAEQDCVTMAAGLAKGGARPVMAVVATFFQRAYDQLSHDVGINNLPVVFVDFHGSIYAMNDVTHLGFFDVAMISNIPDLLMLAPSSAEEMTAMLDQAIDRAASPVVIRVPGGSVVHQSHPVYDNFMRYEIVESGEDVAIIAEGAMLSVARDASALLREKGLSPTVINARILSAVDKETLDTLSGYRHIATLEDGIVDGGFGQKVASYLGNASVKVTCLGLDKQFCDRFSVDKLMKANGLTAPQIADLLEK